MLIEKLTDDLEIGAKYTLITPITLSQIALSRNSSWVVISATNERSTICKKVLWIPSPPSFLPQRKGKLTFAVPLHAYPSVCPISQYFVSLWPLLRLEKDFVAVSFSVKSFDRNHRVKPCYLAVVWMFFFMWFDILDVNSVTFKLLYSVTPLIRSNVFMLSIWSFSKK